MMQNRFFQRRISAFLEGNSLGESVRSNGWDVGRVFLLVLQIASPTRLFSPPTPLIIWLYYKLFGARNYFLI